MIIKRCKITLIISNTVINYAVIFVIKLHLYKNYINVVFNSPVIEADFKKYGRT